MGDGAGGFSERAKPSWRDVLSFEVLSARLSGRPRQLLVLIRHFFNRLFQNEVFPFEEQMKEKLIAGLVMLVVLGGHIAVSLFGKYGMLEKYIFLTGDPGSWIDKCYFIAFFMMLLAFIVVLDWDLIFPDRIEVLNLLPLPIPPGTLFWAKFFSFTAFILLFSIAVNALSMAVAAYFLAQFRSRSFGFLLRHMGAHFLSTTAAFAFTFFLFSLVIACLLLFLSPRLYRRVSLVLRFALLVAIVFFLVMFLVNSFLIPDMFAWLGRVLKSRSRLSLLFPPLWFTGLYEQLLGNHDPVFGFGAATAVASLSSFAPCTSAPWPFPIVAICARARRRSRCMIPC
jgi:hypothetical protein